MPPRPSSSSSTTTTTANCVHIPQDIIEVNILTKFDGPTLAVAGCVSTRFRSLIVDEDLWKNICRTTRPSTNHPGVTDFTSTFPSGYRSFFSTIFSTRPFHHHPDKDHPYVYQSWGTRDLISAVDLLYNNKAVYSNVLVTDTWTDGFRSKPLFIDAILQNTTAAAESDEKITVTVDKSESIMQIAEKLTLSWILIHPDRKQAVNLSSSTPVLIKKHWINRNQVEMQFSTLMANDRCGTAEFRIVVKCSCGGGGGGKLAVSEVKFQALNADGIGLSGNDGLEIIQEAMDRGRKGNEDDRMNYQDYLKMRKEKKLNEKMERLGLGILGCTFFLVIFIAAIFWVPCYFFQVFVIERTEKWIAVKLHNKLLPPPTGLVIHSLRGEPSYVGLEREIRK